MLHTLFDSEAEVGLSLLLVGEDLKVHLLGTLDRRIFTAWTQALTGILAFSLQPHLKLPILSTLADTGRAKDCNFSFLKLPQRHIFSVSNRSNQ